MRKTTVALLVAMVLAAFSVPAIAAVNDIVWRKFITPASEYDFIAASATDHNGNLIIAGDEDDLQYVSKYRPGGALVWKKTFGAVGSYTYVSDIAVDRDGFIYVVGTTDGNDYTEVGFVRKYGPKGGHHWTKKFGPDDWSFTDTTGVAVGPGGNIYVVGTTDGDFKRRMDYWGETSTYIRKYNPAGKVYWTRQFNGPPGAKDSYDYETYATDVAVGPGGGVYVLADEMDWGYYEENDRRPLAGAGGAALGRSLSVMKRSAIQQRRRAVKQDMYYDSEVDDGYVYEENVTVLKKFSPRGGVYWTRRFGQEKGLMAYQMAVDRTGSPVIGGDSRKGSFATKFSHKGKRRWTRFWSGLDVWDVEVDRSRNIYLVGTEGGQQTSWGAGEAVYPLAYARKISPSGEPQWTRTFVKGAALGASSDLDGNLYVFGHAITRKQDFIVKFTH